MNSLIKVVALVIFSSSAFGVEGHFGRIVDLKGEGFISSNGKTKELRKGDMVDMNAEIVIEHSGQVTFSDNADHRFHLGNSTSVYVTEKSLELRSGDLWFQSLNKNDSYTIKTANALIDYNGGEGILTYDPGKGKSQLMVINGMMKLSNLRQKELNLSIGEGHFSFIDNAYDEGAPRDPTPVGEKTYSQLVSLFKGVSPLDKQSVELFKESNHSRAVASVQSEEKKEIKKNEIDSGMLEEYKNSLLEKKSHQKSVKKTVTYKMTKAKIGTEKMKKPKAETIVQIYGQSSKPTVAISLDTAPEKSKSRAPASVLDQEVPSDTALGSKQPGTTSANPYSKEYKQKDKESDKLIEDLKKL